MLRGSPSGEERDVYSSDGTDYQVLEIISAYMTLLPCRCDCVL